MDKHPIFADNLREIVESFVVETHEIFEELDNDLLQLEHHADDQARIDQVFRAVHTVKGTSGFLSLEQLSTLAHHFEDVLNRLRRAEIVFRPAMMDVMFSAFDLMKVLLQQVIDQQLEPIDLDPVIAALKAIAEQKADPEAASTADVSTDEVADVPVDKDPAPEAEAEVPGLLAHEASGVKEASGGLRNHATETIRVEVRRLDNLMDLVGELVLGRNRLLQLVLDAREGDGLDNLLHELDETKAQVDFITTELQAAVMHTRMVQIGRVFNKFPRLVRDLAREFGKEIDLVLEGEGTELDKSLVEEISDPLVHLVRNSADHGIERPEVRLAAGKPARGRMRLAAAHEGNHIVIEIEDDGAGIDVEKVKQAALERGVITGKEAADLSPSQVYEIIFQPGFSTAKTVSQISGRGVGMDVVKTNIARLNGTISIHSTPGEGTRFTLKLPLTLAIIQSLLVCFGKETFAIPLYSVIEVVSLERGDISTIRGHEVIRLREQVVPLVRIGSMLDVEGYSPAEGHTFAVLVGIAHHRIGLVVDALTGQKEIVIKPLGNYLKKVAGVAGSTILGDGRVIMILDVGELVRMEMTKQRSGKGDRAPIHEPSPPALENSEVSR
jgi:two-component system chemotaxis sensor kinase CheA